MRADLSPVDVAVVVVYLAALVLLGAWFGRRQAGLDRYFVGDRDLPWWLVLASIVSTETSTVTFLSVPGLAFNRDGGNLTFVQLALGYAVGRVVIAWLLLPQYFRGELLSAYQVLRQRFDASVQRAASGLFLLTRSVADGLRLYLTALLLQQFTGWDGYVSVLVMGAVMIVFTYLGGVQAVIWTDMVQLLIYLLGALVAGLYILARVPGGLPEYLAAGAGAGKFTWLNWSTDLRDPYTFWAGLIGGAFITMASHGADQLMVQRYLCTRSLAQARLALVLSGGVVVVQFLLFLLVGVGLFVLYAEGVLEVGEHTRNDQVFGLFIVKFLPHGVVGLVVAAVLAAAMSSSLNTAASAFLTDFYRPLRPGRGEGHYLAVSKLMTLAFGAVQVAVGLAALGTQGERSVVEQVLTVAGLTTGMVLGLFLLGRLPRPVGSPAALAGLAVGLVVVGAVWAPYWPKGDGRRGSLLAWPWFAAVGTVTTVAVALAVDAWRGRRGPPGDGSDQPRLDAPR